MAGFMSNIKISKKIIALVLIPTLVMAVFASIQFFGKKNVASENSKLAELANLAVKASSLVHEQQKERGFTAGFVKSNGQVFKNELSEQRKATDQKRKEFSEYLSSFNYAQFGDKFSSGLSDVKNELSKIEDHRRSVDSFSVQVDQAAGYYTALNAKFLDMISVMTSVSSDPGIVRRLGAYASLLKAKERAGIERATGTAGFASGGFDNKSIAKLNSLVSSQDAFFEMFKSLSSGKEGAFYEEKMGSQAISEVNRMRDIAKESVETKDLKGVASEQWFKATTDRINLLKEVEDNLSESLQGSMAELVSSAEKAEYTYLAILIASIGMVGFFSWVIIRNITTSINSLTNAMSLLARGDTSVDVKGSDQKDEIGEMAKAVLVFKDSMIANDKMKSDQERAQKQQQERMHKMDEITRKFDLNITAFMGQFSTTITQLKSTAGSLAQLAESGSSQAGSLSSSTDSASSNVNTVASAAEELSASINEINKQVTRSSEIAKTAVRKAENANEVIGGLLSSAEKIGEVSNLINDIAEQINLLALNATIEAARAGEAGKGFAVVASEVKNLATQTAKATAEIAEHIGKTQEETRNTAQAIKDISSTINEMNEISTAISVAVEEQGAATKEIARSISSAASSTNEVASSVGKLSESASQTGAAATEMSAATENLAKQSDSLAKEVQNFLSDVKVG